MIDDEEREQMRQDEATWRAHHKEAEARIAEWAARGATCAQLAEWRGLARKWEMGADDIRDRLEIEETSAKLEHVHEDAAGSKQWATGYKLILAFERDCLPWGESLDEATLEVRAAKVKRAIDALEMADETRAQVFQHLEKAHARMVYCHAARRLFERTDHVIAKGRAAEARRLFDAGVRELRQARRQHARPIIVAFVQTRRQHGRARRRAVMRTAARAVGDGSDSDGDGKRPPQVDNDLDPDDGGAA